ncbi:MAG: replication endonuclease [Neisseria sp.]|nr:replication endonuclease [Neisseria sp.]
MVNAAFNPQWNSRFSDGSGRLFMAGRWYLPPDDVAAALPKLPKKVREAAEREWSMRANRESRDALCGTAADPREAEASDFVRRLAAPFLRLPRGLNVNAGEEEIAAFAETVARRFHDAAGRGADWQSLLSRCPPLGLETERVFARQLRVLRDAASDNEARAAAVKGMVARLQDKRFWRRFFRNLTGRVLETAMRETGWVNRRKGLYASQETVFRRRSQKRRNLALLEAMVAVNELREEFTLAELSGKSVSNPALRRAELMTRIAGFETIARAQNHAGEFVTLTCPSRFHQTLHAGGSNPKFDGSTPAEAADYLSRVWARIRADLGRQGIKVYGFRVAEPHHDGTPHWHLLLFMPSENVRAFRRTVALHGCRENREELNLNYCETKKERRAEARRRQAAVLAQTGGKKTLAAIESSIRLEADFWAAYTFKNWKNKAASRRVDFKAIDFVNGSAAGYIAKYISKNIDGKNNSGESVGTDFEADGLESTAETAERVDAWAAAWRIRQFQQIGGAPVGVWRELRRLDPDKLLGDDTLMLAARAADKGDWGKFCLLMGGIETARRDMPLALYKENNGQSNRYGEAAADTVRGVIDKQTGEYTISRIHEWSIQQKGGNAAPWTCVNNCTKRENAPETRVSSPEEIAETLAACEPIDEIIRFDHLHPDTWDYDFGGEENRFMLTPNTQQKMLETAWQEARAARAESEDLAAYRRHLALLAALKLDKGRLKTNEVSFCGAKTNEVSFCEAKTDKARARRRFAQANAAKTPRFLPLPSARGKTPEDVLAASKALLAEVRAQNAEMEQQIRH